MKEAIKQAGLAYKMKYLSDAVIVKDNLIIGEGHNRVIQKITYKTCRNKCY